MPALLWTVRAVLLAMVGLHIWSSFSLLGRKVTPARSDMSGGSPPNPPMRPGPCTWSGPIILAFVIYHLLDFTFGSVNPHFQEGNVYANVIASFSLIPVSAFYILAMLLLCMHLYHGLWSMFQSLGFYHPRFTPLLKRAAAAVAILIAAGNISIPIAVLTGLVG